MTACTCAKPAVSANPRRGRLCNRCSGHISHGHPEVQILSCGRCGHRFNALSEGHAGISLVPDDGELWRSVDFKQLHLCGNCRDTLRSWLGILPPGVDPELVPGVHR